MTGMNEATPSAGTDPTRPDRATATPGAGAIGISRLLGAHMPTAGGLFRGLDMGKGIGCTAVQIFTASPRQWEHKPLSDADVAAFLEARERTGLAFVVAHDSYLINLAAPSEEILARSRAAFLRELERAQRLGIDWVVTHMGAHLDQGEEAAVARLVESLRLILEQTDALGYTVGIALETTAGQGTGLGWRFEQLGQVLRGVGAHPRLGICLDTCHVFVAGYELRDEAGYEQTIAEFEKHIGLDRLKVIHANDAKKTLGSRVDRHEHLGVGEIGLEAFARLVTDPRLRHVPIIIETPEAETMHAVNLEKLRGMAAEKPPYISVTVRFFGHYKDLVPEQHVVTRLPNGATVRDLCSALVLLDARLQDIERYCRFAINEEYVDLETLLAEGNEVAVLPPMSGG